MNRYTVRERNSGIFSITSLSNGGRLLKKRICFPRSKLFSLRVDSILETSLSWEINRKSQKFLPFGKQAEKNEGVFKELKKNVTD